ncbi:MULTISPECIES: hypothetical protein [Streptomyces]|uniref:Uncharacterized protein n=1 Tax=Streptomyces radicis TaxID=1750517 RepID=A0A3A9VUV2_9ACTN|nr:MULTISPECIES: hypothetical protein [Streptomyces]RBM10753.1 hypothetical protein DEH69_22695 [Streptomyces sp. PT12]RKN04871.1 hypothetical protein D7319_27115 [Streptomyces radicis]RKN25381.1 hypothetical protein D7318_09275 [Streptomyces radicis]
MEQKIASFMNEQQLGPMEQGYQDDVKSPVLATPAAGVATCWYVGGAVAGAASVVGAYVCGAVFG